MDYRETITGLYYLLICADGAVNEKELLLGKKMIAAEGFDEQKFETAVTSFKTRDKATLYAECVSGLKKLDKQKQIRSIAWLCVIANSDGFMDKEEWMLIYKIYDNELGLSLDEILKTQKELNKILYGKEFLSFGVKMEDKKEN
jgi:uncharacterized tellurite resistance protein B-like protein